MLALPIENLVLVCKYKIMRKLDKDHNGLSKCTSERQYIDTYGGPKYKIHFKYGAIMNLVFMTMMFGAGMPILFPIAFVSLILFYFSETYMIFYFYQTPPTFDENLNISVLN